MPNLTPQQIAFFVILVVAFALLITERIRNDIVALLIVLSLYLTGVLSANEALSGFSSEPAIVVASIFVMAAGLHQTGLSKMLGDWIGRLAGSTFTRAIAVIMPSVALLSAFTHHVTTTAVMLPVTLNLSRDKGIPASRLLMPLSFAASLGTTITIIGAPAFLIASDVLTRAGRPPLGIFSISPIGLAISALGTLFILVVGRFLLPSNPVAEDPGARFRLDDYFTEVTIPEESSLIGKTVDEVMQEGSFNLNVIGWVRAGRQLRAPFGARRLLVGDTLLVRTTPEELATLREDSAVRLRAAEMYKQEHNGDSGTDDDIPHELVQVVVAPGSELVGRSIGDIDFRRRFDVIVVSIWRQRGFLDQELSQIRLRAGDVLVLQADAGALDRVADDPAFLMMVPFQGQARSRRKARLAALIMLGTIVLAASGAVTLEMATLAGALAMMLTRCVSIRQGYAAIDYRIYVFIAGAIPLGVAMEKTHASQMMAGLLQAVVGGWNEVLVLFLLFMTVGVVTQFMSDAGTTAIFAPVAVALAQALHQPLEPYVVTVAMASVAAFFTPIGHHGNLLVYGPGRYQFSDFVRVGTPLTVLVGIAVAMLSPLVWAHY